MWEKLRIVFTIPELRQKILLTLGFLAIYRMGWQIALPVIDQDVMNQAGSAGAGLGDFVDKVAVFAASDLRQATIFGLGIMPYISASIIFQLLGSVWKPIEELRKEGEAGRRKIEQYTRYGTVVLSAFQGFGVAMWLEGINNQDVGGGRFADCAECPIANGIFCLKPPPAGLFRINP